ncbi:cytochrome P450 [Rhizophagus clarus]|uniref:Cytochrome P450 n=1 Tax=Rhizophagus clarus TaxID=94130 RepID=A0A8H3KVK2_9GLOM|nr:cytochrome P450 [Rhizophagus clarus]
MNQKMDSIIKRRRKEIENTPLNKPLTNDLLTSIIIASTLRDFNYNKADYKEVMRPMNDLEMRGIIFDGIIAGTDTVIIFFRGYQCPVETMVRINIDAIHNNEKHWDEPDKFNPDRWMVEGFEPNKNSFIMFGGGLRICPGRKLAMVELVCLMALLFRKYDIDLVDMNAPLKTESDTVIACAELFVEIKLRN